MLKSVGRRGIIERGAILLFLALIPSTVAFQTIELISSDGKLPFGSYETHRNFVRSKSTELKMMNWEDIMFNAQSTASSMASVSLDDPSNLASSIPIMYGAGLLTAFSPCVWGLLPLTISYVPFHFTRF